MVLLCTHLHAFGVMQCLGFEMQSCGTNFCFCSIIQRVRFSPRFSILKSFLTLFYVLLSGIVNSSQYFIISNHTSKIPSASVNERDAEKDTVDILMIHFQSYIAT